MKITKLLALSFCFVLFLMNMQCDDDDSIDSICGLTTVVDNVIYENSESVFYSLVSAEINGDCLEINILSSGCDGGTWVLTLVDSGDIAESIPPQRYLKLVLVNNEACLAIFNKEQSFDLTALRIGGLNEVLLNIEDFTEPLNYIY